MPRAARIALAVGLLAAVPPAARGRVPRTVKLRFPRLAVAPGTNPEACAAIRVPMTAPFDVGTVEIRHRGARSGVAVQHFLVYFYTGEHLDAFSARVRESTPSRGCLDLGVPDVDRRQLIASGTFARSRIGFVRGAALRLTPVPTAPGGAPAGLGFVLDGEWLNGGTRPGMVSTLVTLRRARRATTVALPFTDRSAEAGILVAPGAVASSEALPAGQSAGWGPGRPGAPAGDVCVLTVTGQMHKRGRFLGVDVVGADGHVIGTDATVANPFEAGRMHFFGAFDFSDMGSRVLTTPLHLGAGETLHFACWDDNGANLTGRLGCEEVRGEPPGAVGSPAKPCLADGDCPSVDAAYPGRTFTGACRQANLVAGPTPDDEVCRLDGVYVLADPARGCE